MNPIELTDLTTIGKGLNRPECVLATGSGVIYTADWRGGVCGVAPDGRQTLYKANNLDFDIKPNGIGLMPNGDFLIAHLGDEVGGLFRLSRSGLCSSVLTELAGSPLKPSNYPHLDGKGRIWLTISTEQTPRALGYNNVVTDGSILLIDEHGARVVADGLGYTNECCVHPDGKRLYVNETFGRRLSCFDIGVHGDLSNKRTVTEFGHGTYPDGLTFDSEGGIWITSIVSNRVIHVDDDGNQTILLEDADQEKLDWVEQAYLNGTMGRPHLDNSIGSRLGNISSLAFGGPDMKTVYLGCLLDDTIMTFRSPIAGWKPPYWHYPVSR